MTCDQRGMRAQWAQLVSSGPGTPHSRLTKENEAPDDRRAATVAGPTRQKRSDHIALRLRSRHEPRLGTELKLEAAALPGAAAGQRLTQRSPSWAAAAALGPPGPAGPVGAVPAGHHRRRHGHAAPVGGPGRDAADPLLPGEQPAPPVEAQRAIADLGAAVPALPLEAAVRAVEPARDSELSPLARTAPAEEIVAAEPQQAEAWLQILPLPFPLRPRETGFGHLPLRLGPPPPAPPGLGCVGPPPSSSMPAASGSHLSVLPLSASEVGAAALARGDPVRA